MQAYSAVQCSPALFTRPCGSATYQGSGCTTVLGAGEGAVMPHLYTYLFVASTLLMHVHVQCFEYASACQRESQVVLIHLAVDEQSHSEYTCTLYMYNVQVQVHVHCICTMYMYMYIVHVLVSHNHTCR